MEQNKELYKVKPKYNFIYELFMPLGRKTKHTFMVLFFFVIVYIGLNMFPQLESLKDKLTIGDNINIYNIFSNIFIWVVILLVIKIVAHVIIQIWQYNSIHYVFYSDYLEYSDTFLNQQKKTIMYNNIREIEIRKSIWDRINGYGTIIIYTNAEKSYNNGLILYSIKNPQEVYKEIDSIVHAKKLTNNESQDNTINSDSISEKEKEFRDSLNNK